MQANSERDCFDSPESSNIASTCYIHHQSILLITFKSGQTYEYANVPPEIYSLMKQTHESGGSVGKYFAAAIKPVFAGSLSTSTDNLT